MFKIPKSDMHLFLCYNCKTNYICFCADTLLMLQTRANYIIHSSVFAVLRRVVTKSNTSPPVYHPGVTIFEVHEYNWALKFIAVVLPLFLFTCRRLVYF
jgi:hypothetical protein